MHLLLCYAAFAAFIITFSDSAIIPDIPPIETSDNSTSSVVVLSQSNKEFFGSSSSAIVIEDTIVFNDEIETEAKSKMRSAFFQLITNSLMMKPSTNTSNVDSNQELAYASMNSAFSSTSANITSKVEYTFKDTSINCISELTKYLNENEITAQLFPKLFNWTLDIQTSSSTQNNIISNQDGKQQAAANISNFYPGQPDTLADENCLLLGLKSSVNETILAHANNILLTLGATKIDMTSNFILSCFPPENIPLRSLDAMDCFEFLERDQKVKIQQFQKEAPWGLARLSRNSPNVPKNTFAFANTGEGVNVYVIDSGVQTSHLEFSNNRAQVVFKLNGTQYEDCSGHGTEVSSVIAGTNTGVAKKSNIMAVQVLDCSGEGRNSGLITAIEWIITNHKKPALINMSVGGSKSVALDVALQRAIEAGILVVVAAGNSDLDACNTSPAGSSSALTVGSTNFQNEKSNFSNWGSCVNIFAPGSDILVAVVNEAKKVTSVDGNSYGFVSGTSVSSPFVTGIAALLLERNPKLKPAELKQEIYNLAIVNGLKGDLVGSPNIFAQAPPAGESPNNLVTLLPPGRLPSVPPSPSTNAVGWTFIGIGIACGVIVILIVIIVVFKKLSRGKSSQSNTNA